MSISGWMSERVKRQLRRNEIGDASTTTTQSRQQFFNLGMQVVHRERLGQDWRRESDRAAGLQDFGGVSADENHL